MRNPDSFETLGSQFSVLGDVPNWDSGQTQNLSSIGLCSDTKLEFSGTESPDPDPRESQICLGNIIRHLQNIFDSQEVPHAGVFHVR